MFFWSHFLKARNVQVTTTLENKMLGASDSQQLEFAIKLNSALVTHNRVDFENLFREYIEASKRTAGIISLIRRDVRTMAQRLSGFCVSRDSIENQLYYI